MIFHGLNSQAENEEGSVSGCTGQAWILAHNPCRKTRNYFCWVHLLSVHGIIDPGLILLEANVLLGLYLSEACWACLLLCPMPSRDSGAGRESRATWVLLVGALLSLQACLELCRGQQLCLPCLYLPHGCPCGTSLCSPVLPGSPSSLPPDTCSLALAQQKPAARLGCIQQQRGPCLPAVSRCLVIPLFMLEQLVCVVKQNPRTQH